jgi:hypothetical protein
VQFRGLLLAASIGVALLTSACAAETDSEEEKVGSTDEAMSSKKSSSYGVTTFGGPGDYQALACGGNSRTVNHWYVASSQRYGCNKHLKLTTAKGKCLVVYTADAGPASFVESHAGMPVLDSSPAVGEYLFSEDSLGWSDIAAHPSRYKVNVVVTSDPLGPC